MADTNDSAGQAHGGNAGSDANNGGDKGSGSVIDSLTGTTADDRADLLAKAQEAITGAVGTAVNAVKANPKTAAAIAAGATAAVAGVAYGATKLASSDKEPAKSGGAAKSGTAKRGGAKN